jgi:hypothetical protein
MMWKQFLLSMLKRCLVTGLLVLIPLLVEGGQRSPQVGNKTAKADGEIHHVDFLNFTYPLTEKYKKYGFGNSVRVYSGECRITPEPEEESYFKINKILYGDLTGDGHEEAIILVRYCFEKCNFSNKDVFVYTMQNGSPVLLTRLHFEDMEADYNRYFLPDKEGGGDMWSEGDISLDDTGLLVADRAAGGPHCCPEYGVILKYRWDGRRLTLVEKPLRMRVSQGAQSSPDDTQPNRNDQPAAAAKVEQDKTPKQEPGASTIYSVESIKDAATAIKALYTLATAVRIGVNRRDYGTRLVDTKLTVEEALTGVPDGELKKALNLSLYAYEGAARLWDLYLDGNSLTIKEEMYKFWNTARAQLNRGAELLNQIVETSKQKH